MLSHQSDVCPLAGQQYELWQPLLSLCTWLDAAAAGRAWAPALVEHARKLFDQNREEHVPEEDLILLRALWDRVRSSQVVATKLVLERALTMESDLFRRVSARKASAMLKKYGITTIRVGGKRVYRDVIPLLRRVERNYGVFLNTDGSEQSNVVTERRY